MNAAISGQLNAHIYLQTGVGPERLDLDQNPGHVDPWQVRGLLCRAGFPIWIDVKGEVGPPLPEPGDVQDAARVGCSLFWDEWWRLDRLGTGGRGRVMLLRGLCEGRDGLPRRRVDSRWHWVGLTNGVRQDDGGGEIADAAVFRIGVVHSVEDAFALAYLFQGMGAEPPKEAIHLPASDFARIHLHSPADTHFSTCSYSAASAVGDQRMMKRNR
jgi:hypothetical protein